MGFFCTFSDPAKIFLIKCSGFSDHTPSPHKDLNYISVLFKTEIKAVTGKINK